jgi:transcriptional regulator with XRE-family HTH domain
MRAKPSERDIRLAIRAAELRRLGRYRFGVKSDAALAARLGIYPANLRRLLRGDVQPSGQIIAALLNTLDVPFEALFEVQVVPISKDPIAA